MKLVHVEADNFRSYSKIKWDLPTHGLHLIDGKNLDTGRNNMTGKTTLLDSVFWALYGYLPKWGGPKGGPADAVIKRGTKHTKVHVTVEHAGKSIVVERERPLKLRVFVDQQEIQGKAADLDKMIPALVGATPEQFLISIYMSQNRKTSFFHMSDTERTELLSTVAGLQAMDKALEKAKTRRGEIEKELERVEGTMKAYTEQVDEFPKEVEHNEGMVAHSSADLEAKRVKYEETKAKVDAVSAEAQARHDVAIQAEILDYEASIAAMDRNIGDLIKQKQELQAQIGSAPMVDAEITMHIARIKEEIARNEKEIRSVDAANELNAQLKRSNERIQDQISRELDLMEAASQGKCSHCKQELPADQRDQAAANHLKKAQDLGAQIKPVGDQLLATEFKEAIELLRKQLDEAMQVYATKKAELEARPNQIKKDLMVIEQQLMALSRERGLIISAHESKRTAIQNELKNAVSAAQVELTRDKQAVEMGEKFVAAAKQVLEQVKAREAGLKEKLESAKVKFFTLQAEMDQILDLIDIFGPKGFRAICFEGLIERISERAGELFSIMTDGVYATRIDQVGENGKGEQKLILKPVITKGGLDVALDDLSGGAEATVALAYDVAVSEAVGDSSVLWLDEALDGLDAQGKGEAMRLLEEVSLTRAVILIDHTSEIKAAIQNVIEITYKDETSTLSA